MARGDYERRRVNSVLGRIGRSITIRHITQIAGPNPAINPPSTSGLVVDGVQNAGAAILNIRGNMISGRLILGDKLTIAGDGATYTVQAQVIASLNKLASIPISPVLQRSEADGAVITPTFLNEITMLARVASYPQSMINGTVIQQTDLQVILPALPLTFVPSTTDKLIIDGTVRGIANVSPNYSGDQVAFYTIQAR